MAATSCEGRPGYEATSTIQGYEKISCFCNVHNLAKCQTEDTFQLLLVQYQNDDVSHKLSQLFCRGIDTCHTGSLT